MNCNYRTIKIRALRLFVFIFILTLFLNNRLHAQEAKSGKDLYTVCKACHTIGGGKLIGPDLKGVTERRDEAWLIKFIQNSQEMIKAGDTIAVRLFKEYNNIPMPPNNYTDEQVKLVLEYIKNYDPEAEKAAAAAEVPQTVTEPEIPSYELKPAYMKKAEARDYQAIFIISLILLLVAVGDLVLTRLIKAKFVHIIVIFISVFIMGEIIIVEAQGLGRQQYYSPDQPIAFSHKVHVGQNKIDCKYCHTTAEKSMHAGIPSTQLCMNCHNVVKEGKTTGKDEIAKIYKSLETNKPIEWVKVHNLPDHVFFSHAQHVKVGKLDCKECHGPVETMDRIIQVEDLSMGWCINCHRNTEVQFEANKFYKNYTKLHEELNKGKRSRITVDNVGGNECQKCHY